MIAYILRGHIRMYCFYFVFTGGCGPINGRLISWGTYKQQYTVTLNKPICQSVLCLLAQSKSSD